MGIEPGVKECTFGHDDAELAHGGRRWVVGWFVDDTESRYPAHHRHPNGKETAEIRKRGAGNGLVNVFALPSLLSGQPVTRRGRPH